MWSEPRAPSGIFHFRRRVSATVSTLLKKRIVKKSLGTREFHFARDLALAWWRAYDEFHQHVRVVLMAGKTKDVQLRIERFKREGRHYRLIHKPDGTIEVEAQSAEDHALAREIIESIGVMKREALVLASAIGTLQHNLYALRAAWATRAFLALDPERRAGNAGPLSGPQAGAGFASSDHAEGNNRPDDGLPRHRPMPSTND